ncbi:MAG TPA: NAD(P)/FAD-dependent oxidoreductase, partial [Thermoanaerobaculia bacterium]
MIVGAGVSGIGAACHLARRCPERSFVLLERRADLGGTWDLFRFPGVRSDSDMFTYGYAFRPWMQPTTMADGAAIQAYLRETAAEHGVSERIRYRRRLTRAAWSSAEGRWSLTVRDEETGDEERLACRFLVGCTGYFHHDRGHRPELPGEARFRGPIVHPQHWPEGLDVTGKRVVVVGSGATAVTLVPALARDAAHVTMLQRSPSDVLSLPRRDLVSQALASVLPKRFVYRLARRRNVALQLAVYGASRRWPRLVRRILHLGMRRRLGRGFDLGHFTPAYAPWDQRLCMVPDGDLFDALGEGRAAVVTDRIDTFTEDGLRLASGRELAVDLVVAATGFEVQMLGGAVLEVDGEEVPLAERLTYKGVMVEGVPNAVVFFGYVNASWTLKVDLAG